MLRDIIVCFVFLLNNQLIDCSGLRAGSAAPVPFKLGDEVLLDSKINMLKDKRVALLTNQTGILSDGTHIIDAMLAKGLNVVKIFTPEHGIRGDENYSSVDEKTGIPIISLYNGKYAPSASDLADVDVIVYDIQDVGARFYTYTSTLYYSIASASENGKKMIVCDRPLIINPNYVDGFVLEGGYESFVGTIPAPVCYGLTCGELAKYLSESVLAANGTVDVSEMEGYNRTMNFENLHLKWVKPSPSMYYPSTAVCYGGTCFLEGTNVSEGRGTDKPFEYFGAPWLDSKTAADELNSYSLNGVRFEPITFTPSEKISNYPPKFFQKDCNGVFINVTDKNKFESVKCGIAILVTLNKLCPEFKLNKDNFIDKLAGTDKFRKLLDQPDAYNSIINYWQNGLVEFKKERDKYLIYK